MNNPPVEPTIGAGVTYSIGSDRYVGTIISVSKTGKSFVFQQDNTRLISGNEMTGNAVYEHSPNPNGSKHNVRWTSKGRWKVQGYYGCRIGDRDYHMDPSF